MNQIIFSCHTLFHLFIVLVHYSKHSSEFKYILLLSNDILNVDSLKHRLLQNYKFQDVIISDDQGFKVKLKKIKWNVLFYKLMSNSHLKDIKKQIGKVDDNIDICIFIDCTASSRFLLYNYPKANFLLFEDGLGIYLSQESSPFSKIKNHIIYRRQKYGRDKQIKKIMVEKPNEIPFDIRNKTEKWEISDIIMNLTDETKNKLISFFINDKAFFNKNYDAMLLTQPFSEDGFISETEKIDMYTKIVLDLNLDFEKLLIKSHPRETTNYNLVFSGATVIEEGFPVEILNFFKNFQIPKGITVNSTALDNVLFVKNKNFVGLNNFPELEKKTLSTLQ